jgi:hypothetical protein
MLLHSHILERDYDLAQLKQNNSDILWKGVRTQKQLTTIAALDPDNSAAIHKGASKYLLAKAVGESIAAEDCVLERKGVAWLSEVTYIIRPLLYGMCMIALQLPLC